MFLYTPFRLLKLLWAAKNFETMEKVLFIIVLYSFSQNSQKCMKYKDKSAFQVPWITKKQNKKNIHLQLMPEPLLCYSPTANMSLIKTSRNKKNSSPPNTSFSLVLCHISSSVFCSCILQGLLASSHGDRRLVSLHGLCMH